MKLSTKGRYGLKAMVELAMDYGTGYVSTATLAARQGVSEAYLEQLIGTLRKSGLIVSSRGAQGGYALSRPPEEIKAGEVLRVLEGSTMLVSCVSDEKVECTNACSCSARPLWLRLQSGINGVLNSTTLRDMAEDYKTQLERNSK